MTLIRFFLLLAVAGFSLAVLNPADARNSTPRGYMKSTVKSVGNNPDAAQQNARNFAQKNIKKKQTRNRNAARNERRGKPTGHIASSGVNP